MESGSGLVGLDQHRGNGAYVGEQVEVEPTSHKAVPRHG